MEIKKLELKKIQYFKAMSEETNCYKAVVYVNGKPAIDVRNEGQGGCDSQYPINSDQSIVDVVNDYCKKNFPATVFLHGEKTKENIRQKDILYCDLETWCSDQIGAVEDRKMLKRLVTANKVSFVKGKEIYTVSSKTQPEAAIIAHVKIKHGNVTILNELPVEGQILELRKLQDYGRKDMISLTPDEAVKIPE